MGSGGGGGGGYIGISYNVGKLFKRPTECKYKFCNTNLQANTKLEGREALCLDTKIFKKRSRLLPGYMFSMSSFLHHFFLTW